MAYNYSKKTELTVLVLEVIAYILFLPLLLLRKRKPVNPKRFLFVEPFQMGDVLSLTPMFDALLRQFSSCEIYLLAKPSSAQVLKFDDRVKEVFEIDCPWSDQGPKQFSILRMYKVLRATICLRAYYFEVGLDTRGDLRSQVLMVLAGCRLRLGYTVYLHSNIKLRGWLLSRKISQSTHHHRFYWNLELLSLLGISVLKIEFPTLVLKPQLFDKYPTGHVVIHVGGRWEFKRWAENKWAELICKLATGKKFIFVIASVAEASILDTVKNMVCRVSSSQNILFTTTSLVQMIGLIRGCEKFIGVDSGPMNLAVCLNKPTLVLFGPGDSVMWRPLTIGSRFIHKKEKYPCNPCFQKKCKFPQSSCVRVISVEEFVQLM